MNRMRTKLCLVTGCIALLWLGGCIRWPEEPKPIDPVPRAGPGK